MAKRWGDWRLIVVGDQRFRWKVDFHGWYDIGSVAYAKDGHNWEPDRLFIRPEDRTDRRVIVNWPACKGGYVTPGLARRCIDAALQQGWLTVADTITLDGTLFPIRKWMMILHKRIVTEILRLDAQISDSSASSATVTLTCDVEWPDVAFHADEPFLPKDEFRFLTGDSRGRFFDGWEEHFTSTNPDTQIPFAFDDHYYYLLTENPNDLSDPLVLAIDHEELNEEPDDKGLTVSTVLPLLRLIKS